MMKTLVKIIAVTALLFISGQVIADESNYKHKETKNYSISGEISTEGAYGNNGSNGFTGKTLLCLDVNPEKYLNGHIALKWEDGETDAFIIDEAYLKTGITELPLYIKAGKMYVPFGKYSSNMISDPLTKQMAETRKTAVEAGFDFSGLYGSIYAFGGKLNDNGQENNKIDSYGAAAGYTITGRIFSIDIGAGWINNILSSNGMMDIADTENSDSETLGFTAVFDNDIPAADFHVAVKSGGFTCVAEYITMLKDIDVRHEDLISGAVESYGLQPLETRVKYRSWNLEAGYTLVIYGHDSTLAVACQGVTGAGEFLPETRYLCCMNVRLMQNLTVSLEYAYDKYQAGDRFSTVTGKILLGF